MDPYINEWLNLAIRFAHVITGIAWMGASFYFIWLDNHLQNPPQWKTDKGIDGDLWLIQGGSFYEVAKYESGPKDMPSMLHWFKWEAYATWITGFSLLTLIFYVGAEAYLIDTSVAKLTQFQAIGLGIGAIIIGVASYEILVRTPLKNNGQLLGVALIIIGTVLAYGLTQLFSARGAYMHMGAIIGTIMVGNVLFGIMPLQREVVKAVEKGTTPMPNFALNAKLRATHNTYTALPIIFIMISNHYPMIFSHSANWMVLIAIILITAIIRHYFILRHSNQQKPIMLVSAILAFVIIAFNTVPSSTKLSKWQKQQKVSFAQVQKIIDERCGTCHSLAPTDDEFLLAPAGIIFSDEASIRKWAKRIRVRVLETKDMPFLNKTEMTDTERHMLAVWLENNHY